MGRCPLDYRKNVMRYEQAALAEVEWLTREIQMRESTMERAACVADENRQLGAGYDFESMFKAIAAAYQRRTEVLAALEAAQRTS